MLLNISHDYSKSKGIIDSEVGKPFNLEQRKEFQGVSYSNLPVTAASLDIYNLLIVNEQENRCSIEMRPKGIIISFRSVNETYALVIPHYKLKIYKGRAEEYSFYRDQHFIKIWAGKTEKEVHDFVRKLKTHKSDSAPPRIEDFL